MLGLHGIFDLCCDVQTLRCSMWDLVPWPRIKPRPPALKAWSLSHWTTGKVKVKSLSHVQLFATPWTAAYQATPSMAFSRQEYQSGLLFPSPVDLPNPGIKPGSPALQTDAFPSEPPGKPWTTGKSLYFHLQIILSIKFLSPLLLLLLLLLLLSRFSRVRLCATP